MARVDFPTLRNAMPYPRVAEGAAHEPQLRQLSLLGNLPSALGSVLFKW